jgi:hypothetical protein
MATAAHEVTWSQDFEKALANATREKVVLLDFSAAPM